ncbi:hypothetical protein BP5796_08097 [Coleophoma crateriformis]|uniref:Uncharacterized protein n=1 Tax=Coleophoma crateriformis TaxID=565419 RepID=A0A3D8RDC8_9HELO|nr:hypothetical protein BP5796_08097 [Coleophoma crateriformis]
MAPTPVFKSGNLAVITGGASGIGLSLAEKCASYGMNVLIIDNNGSNLNSAKEALAGKVETCEMDVSKTEDWEKVKKIVKEKHAGRVDLLALNAGIGLNGSWEDAAYFHKIMDVNLFGVVHGLSTFVPLIQQTSTKDSPAHIIVTGSKQGITNPPGNPAYNASKSAVKTLTEHLSFDMSKSSPSTSVHLLVPGWTFTGFSGNSPFAQEKKDKPAGAWTAAQVVDYLETKLADGKFYVICPDNDVDEATDKKRMLWTAGDLVEGRPPLTRWRPEWKETAGEWMSKQKI